MTSSSRSTIFVTFLSLLLGLSIAASALVETFRGSFHRMKLVFHGGESMDAGSTHDRLVDQKHRERSGSFESNNSSASRLYFWDDLQHPFGQEAVDDSHVESPDIVHFCFLLHGHRGQSKDLSYMQFRMQQVAQEEKKRHTKHDMVVHLSVTNEGKTTDGVANGGNRLVEELRSTIKEEMIKRHPELSSSLELKSESQPIISSERPEEDDTSRLYDVSISILGNSLGGLFGRYAIAKLIERHCVWEGTMNAWILDGRFRLHLNVFCTTATPHLGISGHTYVKIPRTAEIGVAHALGDTGRDLFRLNDLLHTMSTSPVFLNPLGAFRSRVAYANAYGTDFAVPASTAAFLSEHSTYPHRIVQTKHSVVTGNVTSEDGSESTAEAPTACDLVIATMYTPTRTNCGESRDDSDDENEISPLAPSNELDKMSQSLDGLGWKKVFVDMRQELPNAEIPSLLRSTLSSTSLPDTIGGSSSDDPSNGGTNPSSAAIPKLQALQMKNRLIESREVALAVSVPEDNRIALPLGHNMIVAFSRTPWSTFMNKGGRPVVDTLANELVRDIFTWEQQTAVKMTKGLNDDLIRQ